jgi:hypothetical protein
VGSLDAVAGASRKRSGIVVERALGGTTFVIARVYDEESRAQADAFLEMTRKLSIFLGPLRGHDSA